MPTCRVCGAELTHVLLDKAAAGNGWYCRCGRGPLGTGEEPAADAFAEALLEPDNVDNLLGEG